MNKNFRKKKKNFSEKKNFFENSRVKQAMMSGSEIIIDVTERDFLNLL